MGNFCYAFISIHSGMQIRWSNITKLMESKEKMMEIDCFLHWERGETCTRLQWESPREKEQLKDQGTDGRMGSKWTLARLVGGGVCSGFAWLRIGTVGGLL
jgi:hypothetical protein